MSRRGTNPEWQQRLKMPIFVALTFVVLGLLTYRFYNYRAEGAVDVFLEDIFRSRYDQAFQKWDAGGSYTMADFLTDWGQEGYYTKGFSSGSVIDSNRKGRSVIVYASIDPDRRPIALIVDNETLKISFSPTNKY
jgi:hypothetical protein